jgi:hypothetical protein
MDKKVAVIGGGLGALSGRKGDANEGVCQTQYYSE